ncbi:MAG: M23 family metallopeptidase [Lachnospiraceae bacterium]
MEEKNKEKTIMMIATCMVLAALTIIAMYMNTTKTEDIQFLEDDTVMEEQLVEEIDITQEIENVDSFTVKNPTVEIIEEEIVQENIGGTKISDNTINVIEDAVDTTELVEQTIVAEGIEEMMLAYDGSSVLWPLENDYDLLMQYSMEKAVYFETLDQYKRNPAMLIAAGVGKEVCATAPGRITDVYYDVETGWTYEMELGGGFKAYYGQLGDLQKEVDTYVAAGDILGYIAEPTKYYTLEGSHLYFAMTENDEPVYPLEYVN